MVEIVAYHKITETSLTQLPLNTWYEQLKSSWHQGEHVEIIGPTGTGKTTVAHRLLDRREYVVALAVKRNDETLERFMNGRASGLSNYKIITKWPPDYPYKRVILWIKPKSIVEKKEQSDRLYAALNAMYMSGGWCIYFDEAGFIAGELGLSRALVVLLSQGRSSYISTVVAMVRPASMVQRIPREALNQPRHKLFFKYTEGSEIDACAKIAGIDTRRFGGYMQALRYRKARDGSQFSDFLYVHDNEITHVFNEGGS
jgi:hypothetical protein